MVITRGTLAVWEYLILGWRKFAWSSLTEAVGAPLLYLLALGFGLGTLVNRGQGAQALGGLSYIDYLAPALLTAAALQTGVNEAAYPVFSRFKWTRVFWGITATPVKPEQIASGQVLYLASRLAAGSVLYYLVILVFGAAGGPAGVLMIPLAVLTGLSFSVWVLALAAILRKEGAAFNFVVRFVLIPMTLFSGSFFPVDRMPTVVRPFAWVSPLWHGNELARAAAHGGWRLWPDLGHGAYLMILTASGVLFARNRFRLRLVE